MFVTVEYMKCKGDTEYHVMQTRIYETLEEAAAAALTSLQSYARTAENVEFTRKTLDKVKFVFYHMQPLTGYEFVNPF